MVIGIHGRSKMKFIDTVPKIHIDEVNNKLFVDDFEVKLIKSLVMDKDKITIEKYRVYVPTFEWVNAWENFIGSDAPSDDEAIEDYDKQKSQVFLDKRTRKPLIYTFVIDKDNKLFFLSKRIELDN